MKALQDDTFDDDPSGWLALGDGVRHRMRAGELHFTCYSYEAAKYGPYFEARGFKVAYPSYKSVDLGHMACGLRVSWGTRKRKWWEFWK